MSVARATSTRSLTGTGAPRSVGARVVVGFQCFITHRAIGECFVPAEQIGVCESGDAAPMSGASQNTHSWAGAPLPLKNATPVERAALTDVVEIGMEMRWIRVRGKADG
jgi:hypothetical protein